MFARQGFLEGTPGRSRVRSNAGKRSCVSFQQRKSQLRMLACILFKRLPLEAISGVFKGAAIVIGGFRPSSLPASVAFNPRWMYVEIRCTWGDWAGREILQIVLQSLALVRSLSVHSRAYHLPHKTLFAFCGVEASPAWLKWEKEYIQGRRKDLILGISRCVAQFGCSGWLSVVLGLARYCVSCASSYSLLSPLLAVACVVLLLLRQSHFLRSGGTSI